VGYMAFSGRLDAAKAKKIASVLRGAEDTKHAGPAPTSSQPASQPVLAKASGEKIEQELIAEELRRLSDDRRRRDLADRKSLVDSAMLKFTREREAWNKPLSDFEQAQKLASHERQQMGMDREVNIVSGLSAKNARDMLKKRPMPDAVRILMAMKPRTATEIIESCKTPEEKAWAVQVLQELSNEDKGRAEQIAKAMR